MKKLLLVSTAVLALTVAYKQTIGQTWQWARGSIAGGATSYDEGESVAIDASGNVYFTGFFQSTTITFGSYTFTKSGSADLFLVKYDSSGNLLWATSAGGTNTDYAQSVDVDPSGNVFITGSFVSPTIIFGNDTLLNINGDDVFLAKYDSSGNVLWAKSAGGTGGTCRANSVATDANGNAFITGLFYASTFSIGSYTLTNTGCQDVFIAKYDSSGNVLWAKNATGTGCDNGRSVTTDIFGNIYLTGDGNSSTITFDSYTLTSSNSGADHVFLIKYDSTGNVLWARSSQGGGSTYGWSTTTDISGNCYVTGTFMYSPNINFGSSTLTNVNQGTGDVFLVKYDTAGNVLWAKSAGGTSNDNGFCVVTNTSKDIFVSGGYSFQSNSSISFGSITLPFPNGGIDPMFIAKYDSLGNALCAFSLQSGGDDIQSIGIDLSGNLYIGGNYMVNPFILGADTLVLTGNENVYTAKFNFNCDINSINEFIKEEQLIIIPNPFSSVTTIQTDNYLSNATLTVYNSQGQQVKQFVIRNSDSFVIRRDNLPSGLYFVRLTTPSPQGEGWGEVIAVDKLVITDK